MVTKPVLEVPVDDANFKAFAAHFEKFRDQLAKTPGAWAGVNKEMRASFESATAAMLAQSEVNRSSLAADRERARREKESSSYWEKIAERSKSFTANVMNAGRALLTMTRLTAEIGGLVGIGGLWGLGSLAGSIGSGRRTSQGLDIGTGSRLAFGLNYGRIVDSNSLLSGVNESLHDPSQLYRLYAAGLSSKDIAGKDTGAVSAQLMDRYRDLALRTDPRMLGAVLKAHGDLIGLQDFERLRSLSPEEYASIRGGYGRDKGSLALSDATQRKWQEFDVQLERAGINVKNALVTGLTPLIPALERLSIASVKLLTQFLDWADKSGAVDKFAKAITDFAGYLTSKDFSEKVKTFETDVVALAVAAHKGLVALGIVQENPTSSAEARQRADDPNSKGNVLQRMKSGLATDSAEVFGPWVDLLPGIAKTESNNGDPRWMHSYGKDGRLLASGKYGLSPGVAKYYGVDPMNDDQARHGSALYLGDLAKHYGGDVPKMLAAYNWGPGNLDKDINRYGGDWFKHLPQETEKYVRKILGGREGFLAAMRGAGGDQRVLVEIRNFTGSEVTTKVGQAAR